MANIRSWSKRSKVVVYATLAVVLPNFFAFIYGTLKLGGDALNGYVQSGHYFVCAHGSCTEVTQKIWSYSYWHAVSAIAGHILVFAELAFFVTTGDIILDFSKRA